MWLLAVFLSYAPPGVDYLHRDGSRFATRAECERQIEERAVPYRRAVEEARYQAPRGIIVDIQVRCQRD